MFFQGAWQVSAKRHEQGEDTDFIWYLGIVDFDLFNSFFIKAEIKD